MFSLSDVTCVPAGAPEENITSDICSAPAEIRWWWISEPDAPRVSYVRICLSGACAKQSFFGRYYATHSLTPSSFTGTELSVQNAGTDDTVNSLVLGDTYIVSPAALNTFHATLDRVGITKFQVPILTPQGIGVQNIYEALPNYSNINITGIFRARADSPRRDW
jgi:hypothetical protein